MDQYQEYIHLSRYARYLDDKRRRETWAETVTRYCDFWKHRFPEDFPYDEIYKAIYELEVMPSMRALMTAGAALERDEVAGYNCAYLPMDSVRSFDESMYILLCGTGVGFSVERQEIAKLPELSHGLNRSDSTIIVPDSKIGWASAFRELVAMLYAGKIPKWDLSRIRPAGTRLRTFGGRASGPKPLEDLFRFTVDVFGGATGRKFNSLEVHDIECKIANSVVVGGVRRSALISLSNLTDERMRNAKSGELGEGLRHRYLANNSVAYTEQPDVAIFLKEGLELYGSRNGERGIFNRVAAKRKVESNGRRDPNYDFGTNPCGEIILRPYGFCNLSEVVVRPTDRFQDLQRKIRIASIIGTFQSTLTNFRYLRPIWKKNAEEERLLGVSMTGIMDHPILSGFKDITPENLLHFWNDSKQAALQHKNFGGVLDHLKKGSIDVNKAFAAKLNIPQSAAITTVKPSGTVSQLVDSASGIHPRYSPYYIRTVRADKKDPLAVFMREKGFPVEDSVSEPTTTDVFSFPVASPSTSVQRKDISAIQQLEHYLLYQKYWCEHNPSITVYYKDNEFLDVWAWAYRHLDELGGVSFLPASDHVYTQAPYTEITKEEYDAFVAKMPQGIDWTELVEELDNTTSSQELACMGGSCEINL